MHLVIEKLLFMLQTESKTNYLEMKVNLRNLYIYDSRSPNKDLPFIV